MPDVHRPRNGGLKAALGQIRPKWVGSFEGTPIFGGFKGKPK